MKTIKFLSVAFVATLLFSCNQNGVTNKPLNTQLDSVSYAVGLNMGKGLKGNIERSNFNEADIDLIKQGFINGLDSLNILMEDDQVQTLLTDYFTKKQQEEQEKQQAEQLRKLKKNLTMLKLLEKTFWRKTKLKMVFKLPLLDYNILY